MTATQDRQGLYDHRAIEARWQKHWIEQATFRTRDDATRPKYYVLDMFPYPSGSGLHVGHPLGYTATDIVARFKRHRGFDVLHPMGWDAFGLPAEQYALKTGVHPAITTRQNIDNFRRQLQLIGLSYDWSREVDTTDPKYYRWTQWIFLQLWKRGLVYEAEVPVNWCPALGCVLANEEVVDGKSEVGGHPVLRRPMKQWMMRITAYAERLISGLDDLDWPESVKALQRNWIGKSEGAEVDFRLELPPGGAERLPAGLRRAPDGAPLLRIFTTRPDTLFGATYMVVSPEHPCLDALVAPERKAACEAYRAEAARKSDLERSALQRDKTGVATGSHAVNPVNGERLPIWVADYVLMGYGTGAIMSVPGHDERDHEFATRFGLPIRQVVAPAGDTGRPPGDAIDVQAAAFVGEGVAVNSGLIDGLPTGRAQRTITAWLAERGLGEATTQYKLRDWLFSRQRYWGEPVPLLKFEDGSVAPLPESDLPLTLPQVERYQPSGTGESPLSTVPEWVNVTDPASGKPARRETHTMPQWAGSCWYYLRFIDPGNDRALVDKDKERHWMPVDLYVGGAEHAVLHLLYARFWHKVLFDLGVVSCDEPFRKLVNQGMILGEDHEKMSKSRGNTVPADEVVSEWGADAFRLFEMFLGPLSATKPWQSTGIAGTHRFLSRFWRLYVNDDGGSAVSDAAPDDEARRAFHATLAKVTEDVDALSFNTAIAAMMELVNVLTRQGAGMPREFARDALVMIEPFAPHLAEELNVRCFGPGAGELAWEVWPAHDPRWLVADEVEMPVQVNGKVRATIRVPKTVDAATLEKLARAEPNVAQHLEGVVVKKVIAVPGRILNFVTGPK